jgi:acyl dehydratase
MTQKFFTPQNVQDHIGETFTSDWLLVDQLRINVFGAVTEDADPHHIDPEFCEEHSPWGKPIAFGFLTLSLMPALLYQVCRYPLDCDPEKEGYPANFGTDYLRFVAPVYAGSRIRAHVTPKQVNERKPGQKLMVCRVEMEIEGGDQPALVADWQNIWFEGKA